MLVWYKKDGLRPLSFADCEIAWTSFNRNSMVYNCRWHGFIRDSREERTGHPNPKALEVLKWCVNEFSNENDIIMDPFVGSGTTLVACEELNRKWIGIEIEEKYCEIAKQRIGNLIP
jgi:DNA modification methylase